MSETPVVVLGSGGAGLRAALEIRRAGLPVAVVTKGGAGSSGATPSGIFSYCCARPGDPGNTVEKYREDLLRSGRTMNDPDLVELMCRDGYARLEDLTGMGMPWTRTPDGRLAITRLPGHQVARAFHSDTRTGRAMSDTLLRACLGAGVRFEQYKVALDLLLTGGALAGLAMLDLVTGEASVWPCDAVIVAAGGAPAIYRLHSNPPGQTGDGMALVLRAGGELVDMEYVQMYPTVMVAPPGMYGMQLPTARVFGQGARLLNRHGEEFFGRWEKVPLAEATRDLQARGIAREIAAGGGTEAGGIYLDARNVPEGMERGRYNRFLREIGFDLNQLVPQVAPGAHYSMGGIAIAPSTACRGVAGVFAAGEVVGSVHGANRLAGTALVETQVFGALAGRAALEHLCRQGGGGASGEAGAAGRRPLRPGESPVWDTIGEARRRPAGEPVEALQRRVRDTMQERASVVRTAAGLERALAEIEETRRDFSGGLALPSPSEPWHPELLAAVETANMLEVAAATVASALARAESRGSHFRDDNPDRREGWDYQNLLVRGPGEAMAVYRRDRRSGEEKEVWP